MIFGLGTGRVGGSQKVAETRKPTDPKGCFTVAWERHEARVADIVSIKGTAHIRIEDPTKLTVNIWHNGTFYTAAQNVKYSPTGQITAAWKISPRRMGTFEQGLYQAVISYGSLSGTTTRGLRIIKPGKSGDGFDG